MNIKEVFEKDRFAAFQFIIEENFEFLIEKHDFIPASSEMIGPEQIRIRYLSKKVFINFVYGAPGFEFDVTFGRIGIDNKKGAHAFSILSLPALNCHNRLIDSSGWSAFSYENLCHCAKKALSILLECGDYVFNADESFYENLKLRVKKDHDEFIRNMELQSVRSDVVDAWGKKDYKQVIILLESILDDLTPAELSKLKYSKNKMTLK